MNQKLLACLASFIFIVIACEKQPLSTERKSEVSSLPKVIAEREKVEKIEPPPPEVKIKLRRDGKDSYSWELSGSDVDQILKVNEKLRKQLTGDQPR